MFVNSRSYTCRSRKGLSSTISKIVVEVVFVRAFAVAVYRKLSTSTTGIATRKAAEMTMV